MDSLLNRYRRSEPIDTLVDLNIYLDQHLKEPLIDPRHDQRFNSKLIYLTETRPRITFIISVPSQYM